MKKCKNCKYWDSPHEGYYDSETKGCCTLFNNESIDLHESNSSIMGCVEGCVDVSARCYDFEFVTQENFGCIHFKKNKL